ncbi:histidine--tRNA ligase [Thermoplasma sp.]|uniref:histidine--tRNA ligase n=1 Tax=Thermoplasma sp. TaxID=1973142 RepID=UPI001277815D|nr:histidine--tRNA ligase [Thermoplasma sp.]KAA8922324.1 MAG: histidine--tRNA ligase [Thermoplasma sp.]
MYRLQIEKIRGFRDFYPEDMDVEKFIFRKAEEVAEAFGFRRIDFPSLEYLDLYRLKSGEELLQQTYSFVDKGGREVTLIPEATPSTVRMVTSRKDLPKPLRWYSFPKVWRYEEPQAGRYREHYQFNADIFGSDSPEADAEVIALASSILDALGLSNVYEIRINSRKIMEEIIGGITSSDPFSIFSIIDRYHKISRDDFTDQLRSAGVGEDGVSMIVDLCSGTLGIDEIEKITGRGSDEITRMGLVKDLLGSYGVRNVRYDFSIVRGLSYYTGIVFEAYDRSGQFRAILGGGRYDNLASLMSGDSVPAVGFGMGDAVISLLLRRENVQIPRQRKSVYMCRVGKVNSGTLNEYSRKLRDVGIDVTVEIMERGLSSQLKYASAINADYALIFGERDLEKGNVTLRDMRTGEQETVSLDSIVDHVVSKAR